MLFRYGKFTVENLIHLVLDSPGDLQPTLWYICEFHSWKNSEDWPITRLKSSSSSSSSFSSERDATAKKDLAQREKNLKQKEKTIAQKEKNLAQKENLLQQKLLQAELREREALEFEQEAKIKLEEVDEKEQELEAEKLALKKNKNKARFSTSDSNSIPTHHDAENADDNDENPTTNNENNNNNDNNQWLLRFSNLQQRLETAYREIENLRRPVFPAATTTNITTATANGDDNNNDNDTDDDDDDSNEKSSSIITSLQHELKQMKENAQKLKEENILLRKTIKDLDEQNVSSEQNVSFLRRRGIRDNLDNLDVDVDEASSVGNRWAPLNFRVERRMGSAMGRGRGRREGEEEEEGIVGMIEMQKEFKFLGRLR